MQKFYQFRAKMHDIILEIGFRLIALIVFNFIVAPFAMLVIVAGFFYANLSLAYTGKLHIKD